MTRARTKSALQRSIPKHTDSQTGDLVMTEKFLNYQDNGGNGRSSPDYGNTRLGGERPLRLFYPGIFADAAITLAIVCALVVAVLALTP